MFVESVERGRLFTKYTLPYSGTLGQQKQNEEQISLPKMMSLLRGKQMFVNVPFQSTKHNKKEIIVSYVDNTFQEFIGGLYCPTCKNKNSVYIRFKQKSSIFLTVRSEK